MKKRLIKTAKPTAILLAIGFAYILFTRFTGLSLFCPFWTFFHIYCPGCGVSRMLIHLSQLEFYEAFSSNCVLFCLLPVFIAAAARRAYRYVRYGLKGATKIENVGAWIIAGILIVFAVVRNIWQIDILIP